MPATSMPQARTARMAYAVKMGKAKMEDMPEGAREAIKGMMEMSGEDLQEMMQMKKRRKTMMGKG